MSLSPNWNRYHRPKVEMQVRALRATPARPGGEMGSWRVVNSRYGDRNPVGAPILWAGRPAGGHRCGRAKIRGRDPAGPPEEQSNKEQKPPYLTGCS